MKTTEKMTCPCCGLPVSKLSGYTMAKFVGYQKTPLGDFRLYNVVGNHPLNGSTVSVETLINEGINIYDMTPEEIAKELDAIKAVVA